MSQSARRAHPEGPGEQSWGRGDARARLSCGLEAPLATGLRPAGHGSRQHYRKQDQFSWVWKPGTGMKTVLSLFFFVLSRSRGRERGTRWPRPPFHCPLPAASGATLASSQACSARATGIVPFPLPPSHLPSLNPIWHCLFLGFDENACTARKTPPRGSITPEIKHGKLMVPDV